jgi:hypothetical protein
LPRGWSAQTSSDWPQRVEQKRTDLTAHRPWRSSPNTSLANASTCVFITALRLRTWCRGASVHAPGKDAMMLPTGATVLNLRDVKHGGFKIVGDTSLKLLAVHVIDRGKPLYDYSK